MQREKCAADQKNHKRWRVVKNSNKFNNLVMIGRECAIPR